MINHIIIVIIIIIIIFLFIFYYYYHYNIIFPNNEIIENYDARISGITREQCGTYCTETVDCVGFSHDEENGKCYLSKRHILFQPTSSLYAQEYDIQHYRCNKIDAIRTPYHDIDNLDDLELVRNTVYMCQNDEDDEPNLFRIANNKITKLPNNSIVDRLPLEKYNLFRIKYPTCRQDLDTAKYYDVHNNKLNNYLLFKKDKSFYSGEYLYPYKCVKNIPKDVCINICSKDENCVGVEFNTQFENNKNVCCPKKTIGDKNVRTRKYYNGAFYMKQQPNNLDKNKLYINI